MHLPPNIVQFVCGQHQSLFLESKGNVFSVGYNANGELGLGHNRNENVLKKIPNIPRITEISCVYPSCYLIDFEGNLWTFGLNNHGQLGHGDHIYINVPKIIPQLKDIQQISYGCSGFHFLAKNSQNQIFVSGNNDYGQLGTGDTQSFSIPKEMNSQYSGIWGINQHQAETTQEMGKLEMIQSKIKQVKLNLSYYNNNKIKQEFPQNSFESWTEVNEYLNKKWKKTNSKMNQKQEIQLQKQKDVQTYENELKDIENQLLQLQSRKIEIEENFLPKAKQSLFSFEESYKKIENNQKILTEMCSDVSTFCKNENEMNQELFALFKQKKFEEFDCYEISKCLWKMDLFKYQSLFELNQISGAVVLAVEDPGIWEQLGLEKRDCFKLEYNFEMMKSAGFSKTLSPDYEYDCCVCSHNTPEKTIHLLDEYEIPIENDFILKNNYTAPMLLSALFLKDLLRKDSFSQTGIQIMLELEKWKDFHKIHMKDLNNK